MTYGHIWSTASVSSLRDGIHQLTTDAEITEFNVSIGVQKNVRRFHICKQHGQQHNYTYVVKRRLGINAKIYNPILCLIALI